MGNVSDVKLFQHDCNSCIFLGNYKGCDLYICKKHSGLHSLIAREGNEGSEYRSGLWGYVHNNLYREIHKRALARGVVSPEESRNILRYRALDKFRQYYLAKALKKARVSQDIEKYMVALDKIQEEEDALKASRDL